MDIYYVDGKFLPADEAVIPVTDLSVLRGIGAFDFMRTYSGKPFCMRAHLERLEESARKIGLRFPWSKEELARTVMETLSRNSHKESNIRIIVTGGSSPDFMTHRGNPRLIIMVSKLPEMPQAWYENGIKIITQVSERPVSGAKSTNYLQATIALENARKNDAQECLYVVPQGIALEGTTSNVFAILGNTLVTPGRGILPGVTRQAILDMSRSLFSVQIRDVFLSELTEADEVFISGTNKGIVPVVKINDSVIKDGKPGPKTIWLMSCFEDFVLNYNEPLRPLHDA